METFIKKYQINDTVLCEQLINYHKNNNEYKSIGRVGLGVDKNIKDSIDVVFYNNSNNETIKKYFNYLSSFLNQYISNYNIKSNLKTNNTNLIQYYPKGGGFKTWHCERKENIIEDVQVSKRALVYMTYLNTITDKGETEWYYQKVKIKPKTGLTVIWPTDFTHYHRGIPSQTQEKYIVTGWFNFI